MTQVSRYGHMLKMRVDHARMHVTARYRVEGSVLNDTVQAQMVGVETRLELDSPEPPEKIARLVRNAERGCFVMQGLLQPVPIAATTVLNGQPLPAPA
jgi:OsmC-like protein